MNPLVSILTPTYNQEQYIERCIESVLSQTFNNWEMLIVDDGSDDDTGQKVKSYKDHRIVLIDAPHRGIEKLKESYGLALERSTGHLLAILDGDDWWPPDKLEMEVPAFENPSTVLAFGEVNLYNGHNEFMAKAGLPDFAQGLRPGNIIIDKIVRSGYFPFSVTTMVRRSAIEALGGFIQPAGLPLVDVPTWLNILLGGYCLGIPKVLGCYRIHDQSVCQRRSVEIQRGQMRYNERFIEFNRDKMGFSEKTWRKYSRKIKAYHNHRQGLLDMQENNWSESLQHFKSAIVEGNGLRKVKTGFRIMQLLWCLFRRKVWHEKGSSNPGPFPGSLG